MSNQATIALSLSIKRDSTAQTIGIALSSFSLDLAATPEMDGSQKTLSTSYASLDFDEVSTSEITWGAFINHSSTEAEIATIAKQVALSTNFTADSTPTVAGASVPATPATGGAGRYRSITSDGTSQGVDWKTGDIAVYLGTSGTWGRIPVAEMFILEAGEAALMKLKADGQTLYAKSASGTPQIGWAVAGALA